MSCTDAPRPYRRIQERVLPILLSLCAWFTSTSPSRCDAQPAPLNTSTDLASKPRDEGDPGPRKSGPCEPLRASPIEIALAPPLAVGQARDGTTIVIDRVGSSDARVFVGAPGSKDLFRKAGGGLTAFEPRYVWARFELEPRRLVLRLNRTAWDKRSFGTDDVSLSLTGDRSRNISVAHAAGELLAKLPPTTVSDWNIHNFASRITAEYLGETADGRFILVTRPDLGPVSYNHVRVFFGTAGAVVERQMTSFGRGREGGTTEIGFQLGSSDAIATFPARCFPELADAGRTSAFNPTSCGGTLAFDGSAQHLRLLDVRNGLPARLTFICSK